MPLHLAGERPLENEGSRARRCCNAVVVSSVGPRGGATATMEGAQLLDKSLLETDVGICGEPLGRCAGQHPVVHIFIRQPANDRLETLVNSLPTQGARTEVLVWINTKENVGSASKYELNKKSCKRDKGVKGEGGAG